VNEPEQRSGTCETDLDVDGRAWLVCSLPENHPGLHYDRYDDISYRKGKPEEVTGDGTQ
jgi:hypothetical protein